MQSCPENGPGYKTPLDAMRYGPKEKILYVLCIQPNSKVTGKPDYLATVNVDPNSSDYCKVIHRTKMLHASDEIHHFGWNACSSCYGDCNKKRDKLVIPSIVGNRIYIVDVSNETKPTMHKVIEPEEISKLGVGTLHTTHCLGTGEVLISTMGDNKGNGKGEFVVIDADTWKVKGLWTKGKQAKFGYDFWYQPYHDVMVATEWSAPARFTAGFKYEDLINEEVTGRSLNVYSWSKKTLIQTIDLGEEGITPLEVKFLHEPTEAQGYFCCGLTSNIFRFYKKEDESWACQKAIDIPNKKVSGWILSEMPALSTAMLISLDDNFLYVSNWFHGNVRQYDIRDRAHPKLTGEVCIGGLLTEGGPIRVIGEEREQYPVKTIKGTVVYGAPQMLQLSLDGKRLYATTSLFSVWDNQVYPDLGKHGSVLMKIDCNTEEGGLTLDENFLVDFGQEPEGPVLAHESRYPGGDCTSDIWLKA